MATWLCSCFVGLHGYVVPSMDTQLSGPLHGYTVHMATQLWGPTLAPHGYAVVSVCSYAIMQPILWVYVAMQPAL